MRPSEVVPDTPNPNLAQTPQLSRTSSQSSRKSGKLERTPSQLVSCYVLHPHLLPVVVYRGLTVEKELDTARLKFQAEVGLILVLQLATTLHYHERNLLELQTALLLLAESFHSNKRLTPIVFPLVHQELI